MFAAGATVIENAGESQLLVSLTTTLYVPAATSVNVELAWNVVPLSKL